MASGSPLRNPPPPRLSRGVVRFHKILEVNMETYSVGDAIGEFEARLLN